MTISSFRFLPRYRLKKPTEFKRVYDQRCSAADDRIVVYIAENGLDHPRIGLSVSRKVGGAVERNRWKRLLREAFRLSIANLPVGLDMVVIPRPTYRPQLVELQQSLVEVSRRAARRRNRR
jgi:ribonuclease P protein component